MALLRRTLGLVVLIALLAGCRLTASVDLAVERDGSGRLQVVLTADPELVAKAPGLIDDLRFDDLQAVGWQGPSTGAGGGPPLIDRRADGSVAVTMVHAFADLAEANRLLASLNGPAGPLRNLQLDMTPSFGRLRTTVAGAAGLSGLDAFADDALRAALGPNVAFAGAVTDPAGAFDLEVTVRAPGRVVATSPGAVVVRSTVPEGAVDTRPATVTWRFAPIGTAETPLEATIEWVDDEAIAARDRRNLAHAGLVAWGALLVLATGGIVAAVVRRRRR
ncbi:MAG: hypothetical protein ACKO91_16455 [Acidimicrobiales bacterium]